VVIGLWCHFRLLFRQENKYELGKPKDSCDDYQPEVYDQPLNVVGSSYALIHQVWYDDVGYV